MASLQMGMFVPKSEWVPPSELPDIFDAKKIAIDVETRDPDLKRTGRAGPPATARLSVTLSQQKTGQDICPSIIWAAATSINVW